MADSIVIGIHGLKNKPRPALLEEWWGLALAEGLKQVHATDWTPAFRLAYWADIQNSAFEPDNLTQKYVKSPAPGRRTDQSQRSSLVDMGKKYAGKVLDKYKDLAGEDPLLNGILGLTLEDLHDYYQDKSTRRGMRSRLSDLLEECRDKRILLITHSMGSIIAYDVMRLFGPDSRVKVDHLITIGSPLGLPLVRKKIIDEFDQPETPLSVGRWTNIADPDDKVALDCRLIDDFRPNAKGVAVTDLLTKNDYVDTAGVPNNHKSYGYLRAPELADILKEFLDVSA